MKKTRMLTEGAMLAAIFAVLMLVFLYVPIIGGVSMLFLILPFLIYGAKYPLKYSLLFFIVSIFVSLLFGTVTSIPITVIMGTTGLVIGYCIRLEKSKFITYIAASATFLIDTVVGILIAIKFFHINYLDEELTRLQQSINQSRNMMKAFGQQQAYDRLNEMSKTLIYMVHTLLPSLLLLESFFAIFILMLINYPIAKKFGIRVPKWKPFREFNLPKNFQWYFLTFLILSLFFGKYLHGFLSTALLNILFIFLILMILQGFSLICYYGYIKKWPKAILVFIVIITLIYSPLLYAVIMLGIIDLGFNLRAWVNRDV
ncbi:YybS family protein [Heyndrickxia ginsengihumi]|uniref:YybS family protein n=1 Tax=Heyndrickxia ginsengihumi TaxID=363870 RepID=UPI003D1CAAB0